MGFLFIIAAGILIFLIIREVNCWYWKVNDIVDRLENIETKLNEHSEGINNKLAYICENGIKVVGRFETDTSQEDWINDIVIK